MNKHCIAQTQEPYPAMPLLSTLAHLAGRGAVVPLLAEIGVRVPSHALCWVLDAHHRAVEAALAGLAVGEGGVPLRGRPRAGRAGDGRVGPVWAVVALRAQAADPDARRASRVLAAIEAVVAREARPVGHRVVGAGTVHAGGTLGALRDVGKVEAVVVGARGAGGGLLGSGGAVRAHRAQHASGHAAVGAVEALAASVALMPGWPLASKLLEVYTSERSSPFQTFGNP